MIIQEKMEKSLLKKHSGFTLIELMIVVAIIAILAAIAIPNFIKFQMKSRQSEAVILMAGLYDAEIAFYAKNSVFTKSFKELDFSPMEAPKYYKNWYLNLSANSNNFTATCSADLDNDHINDLWIITERNREPHNSFNDIVDHSYPYPY